MNREELAFFLCKGGFCPRLYEVLVGENNAEMAPFFNELGKGSIIGCKAYVGSNQCYDCIEKFLQNKESNPINTPQQRKV